MPLLSSVILDYPLIYRCHSCNCRTAILGPSPSYGNDRRQNSYVPETRTGVGGKWRTPLPATQTVSRNSLASDRTALVPPFALLPLSCPAFSCDTASCILYGVPVVSFCLRCDTAGYSQSNMPYTCRPTSRRSSTLAVLLRTCSNEPMRAKHHHQINRSCRTIRIHLPGKNIFIKSIAAFACSSVSGVSGSFSPRT